MRPSVMNLCFCSSPRLAYKGLAASTIFSKIRPALREAVRLRSQAVHRRQVIALFLLQGEKAWVFPSLTADSNGSQSFSWSALSRRLVFMLLSWPLIAASAQRCTSSACVGCLSSCAAAVVAKRSGEGGRGRHGGKRPKESAFHEDASSAGRFFLER